MRWFLGIDPGFTGAVAIYCPETGALVVEDMPVLKDPKGRTVLNHKALFELLRPTVGNVIAYLEKVAAMRGQGVSSTFRFGQGYGAIEMALAAHEIPTHDVTPAKWKRRLGLSSDKGVSRGLATKLFPSHAESFKRVKDDGRAEAALIAYYGAQQHKA